MFFRTVFYSDSTLLLVNMRDLLLLWHLSLSTAIKTYFMNKNWDGLEPLPYDSPDDIECLQEEGQFSLPTEITVCFRAKPMSWVHPRFPFAAIVGFGTKLDGDEEMREGIVLGVWRSGTWIGIKPSTSDSYVWVIGSPTQGFNFQVRKIFQCNN